MQVCSKTEWKTSTKLCAYNFYKKPLARVFYLSLPPTYLHFFVKLVMEIFTLFEYREIHLVLPEAFFKILGKMCLLMLEVK